LSGFWSKDEILAATYQAWKASPFASIYCLLFFSALFTAGLTAFYTARAYFKTFWGEERFPPETGHHAHESPPIMAWPLRILAVGAVGVGLILGPTNLFAGFLESNRIELQFEHFLHTNWLLMFTSIVIALVGIGIAYWMYVVEPSADDEMARRMATLYEFSRSKFYFDEIYELLIVKPMTIFSHVCRIVDAYLLDGLVDLIGQVPALLGYLMRPWQDGLVQRYALIMALALAGFLLSVSLR
jgi:NADH-quinone oxidoreductase subunit L